MKINVFIMVAAAIVFVLGGVVFFGALTLSGAAAVATANLASYVSGACIPVFLGAALSSLMLKMGKSGTVGWIIGLLIGAIALAFFIFVPMLLPAA